MNWRGRPLTSHDVIVTSIKATTTSTGLTVHAELDPGTCDTGIKVTDTDIDALPMHRHRFHGDWNYTLYPQHRDTAGAAENPRPAEGLPAQSRTGDLRNPELTGMTEPALDALVAQLSQKLDELRDTSGRSIEEETVSGHAEPEPRTSSPPPTESWPPFYTCANSEPET